MNLTSLNKYFGWWDRFFNESYASKRSSVVTLWNKGPLGSRPVTLEWENRDNGYNYNHKPQVGENSRPPEWNFVRKPSGVSSGVAAQWRTNYVDVVPRGLKQGSKSNFVVVIIIFLFSAMILWKILSRFTWFCWTTQLRKRAAPFPATLQFFTADEYLGDQVGDKIIIGMVLSWGFKIWEWL